MPIMELTNAQCVNCDGGLREREDLDKGAILDCFRCGTEVEVVSTAPVEVRLAFEDHVDWEE